MTQLDVEPSPAQSAIRADDSAVRDDNHAASRWWAFLAVVVLVSAVAVWIVSPRFAIDSPSFVDDWSAISETRDQLADVVRLVNPEEQRFRPGWIVWNYLQWHTLDAPQGLVGPNAWNVALRIAVLVAGLGLLTLLALPVPRGRTEAVVQAGLAGIPALLVVTVPKLGVDLARFGPQEPLLVGGMALGGSLLVLAARALLDDPRPVSTWKVGMLAVAGSLFWLLGVYQKETSLAALPLIAAVLVAGRSRTRSWGRLSGARRAALGVIGALVVLPFVHVAVEAARIVLRGDLVYDAEVDSGRGIVDGLDALYDWSHEALSPIARLAIVGAVVLTVVVACLRRKVDWVALGALVSGALWFVLTAQSETVATRYYLPGYALAAVALSLSLARLPRPLPLVGLSAVALFQLAVVVTATLPYVPDPGAREEVRNWAEREEQSAELTRRVASLQRAGCTVAVAGLLPEADAALPVLVSVAQGVDARSCGAEDVHMVVGPLPEGVALTRACAPGARQTVFPGSEVAALELCRRLRAGRVQDPEYGLVSPAELVELRRLATSR